MLGAEFQPGYYENNRWDGRWGALVNRVYYACSPFDYHRPSVMLIPKPSNMLIFERPSMPPRNKKTVRAPVGQKVETGEKGTSAKDPFQSSAYLCRYSFGQRA